MTKDTDFKSSDKGLKKQLIVDAAVKIFHEKGYRAATLNDVARELGVTKAALYTYVSSKRNLLSIIYIQALESFFAEAYKIGESDLAPPEKMRVLIRHHIKHIVIDNLSMFAVFFSEENQLPEEDFKTIRKEQRKYNRVFETIIEEGIAQGYFRACDPGLHTCAILGMCNWLYRWYKPGNGRKTPEEIADHFIDLLENGYTRSKDQPNRIEPVGATESEPKAKTRGEKELLERLRDHAQIMTELIDELETIP